MHANSLLSIVKGSETQKSSEQHRMGLMGLFPDPSSFMDVRLLVMLDLNLLQSDFRKVSDYWH